MSKKNNTAPAKQEIKDAEEKRRLDATKIFLIVFAAVALVGIIASVVVAVVLNAKKKSFDYMKADLSKYVYVSEALYDGYTLDVSVAEPTDIDVETAIIKLLCSNKTKPDKTPINRPGVTLSAGDVANIYYRGYTLENGVKSYFDGGCNFSDSLHALEIGSGSFIAGFEYNLIGKNQNDYATMSKVTSGNTQHGDVIGLTYSAIYADGTSASAKTVMIDLADPTLDERWGEGFSAYFNNALGREIGKLIAGKNANESLAVKSTKVEGAEDIYYDMTINTAYRVDFTNGDKLEVDAYFPADYQEESLRGKTATFEVYIVTAQDYEAPEFNDEFITETLKVSADLLAEYEGDSLAEKYRKYLEDQLYEEYKTSLRAAKEDAFWVQVLAGAEFKDLPESEVEASYDEYIAEITSTYESGYSSYYSSLDAFAREYLGLGSTADWKSVVRVNAEDSVKQKLIFYYIVREKNFEPTDAEYDEVYDKAFAEHLQSYLDYYGITEDDEDYEAQLETGKKTVLEAYGADYFDELVIYEFAMDKILALEAK